MSTGMGLSCHRIREAGPGYLTGAAGIRWLTTGSGLENGCHTQGVRAALVEASRIVTRAPVAWHFRHDVIQVSLTAVTADFAVTDTLTETVAYLDFLCAGSVDEPAKSDRGKVNVT
jgi:hypothetical protein